MAVSSVIRTRLRAALRGTGSVLVALSWLTGGVVFAQPVELDKVLAIVNDDVVLKSEFDARWTQVQQQLATAQGPVPPEAEVRKQLLDQLIMENLQMQLARRAGVRVDDNQINQ
ncbi:MAG: SurA N-terminal domain-containing protein, partial [Pseudohongiellaceae bacterium]